MAWIRAEYSVIVDIETSDSPSEFNRRINKALDDLPGHWRSDLDWFKVDRKYVDPDVYGGECPYEMGVPCKQCCLESCEYRGCIRISEGEING